MQDCVVTKADEHTTRASLQSTNREENTQSGEAATFAWLALIRSLVRSLAGSAMTTTTRTHSQHNHEHITID